MRNKLIGAICLTLGIIIIVTTGTSFAYFSASVQGDPNKITGTVMDFDVDLDIEATYQATQLIPLEDEKISTAVNNDCIDSKGYQVCSLFKITLTNNGDPIILNGHIASTDETTYTTDHLKGQLFDENLTNSVSNVLSLSNNEQKQYFKVTDTNLFTTEVVNENVLYLAVWLTEIHDYQEEDYSKKYFGKIAFESIDGQTITANFNA